MHSIVDFPLTRRRSASYRALAAEIQANLDALGRFWSPIKPPLSEDEIHWVHKVVYARQFVDAGLPQFSRSAFDAWSQRRQPALSRAKVERVIRLYQDLASIVRSHSLLRAALARDLEARALALSGQDVDPPVVFEEFLGSAGSVWTEVWHTVERVLQDGNPLR